MSVQGDSGADLGGGGAESDPGQGSVRGCPGITATDVETCCKVLQAVASAGEENLRSKEFKQLRRCLHPLVELLKGSGHFGGLTMEQATQRRVRQKLLNERQMKERAADRRHIQSGALREGRIRRLEALKAEAGAAPALAAAAAALVPDGVPLLPGGDGCSMVAEAPSVPLLPGTSTGTDDEGAPPAADEDMPDGELEAESTGRGESAGEGPPAGTAAGDECSGAVGARRELHNMRACYTCKRRFRELHAFYDQLCPPCAALNWQKRLQTADMTGRVAVVTGARVKIGFQIVLKLLRCGAEVVALTRFPFDAAVRYSQEADWERWRGRLHVVGLDLRDLVGLEAFTAFLTASYASIDVLINNACQTVRRPASYYAHLVAEEAALRAHGAHAAGPPPYTALLHAHHRFEASAAAARGTGSGRLIDSQHAEGEPRGTAQALHLEDAMDAGDDHLGNGEDTGRDRQAAAGVNPGRGPSSSLSIRGGDGGGGGGGGAGGGLVSASASMSQIMLLPEDVGRDEALCPEGARDVNGQQIDLRNHNSWLLKLEEVSSPELVEVLFVNAVAPFVLNSRLQPLMLRGPQRDRHIINVSAMEGKFYRYKTPNHPHTNMAKAALNMMTRTSAEDWSKRRIFMNAVDTGWINDENPRDKAARIAKQHDFQTPIDEVDAAARVLDPVMTGINTGHNMFGQFLKDYAVSEW